MKLLEVCIESLASAHAARQGGADRLEICSALGLGGLTPSIGLISAIQDSLDIPAMVMIRPRHGDFCYSLGEWTQMEQTIHLVKELGVQGVVFGCLHDDNRLDIASTALLVKAAEGMEVTFHRAFDLIPNPQEAMESLIEMGITRILTSGQAATAWEGRELIRQLVEQADGRISILPGAGISAENVADLIDYTGVTEVHSSGSEKRFPLESRLLPGSTQEKYMPHYSTKVDKVSAIKEQL